MQTRIPRLFVAVGMLAIFAVPTFAAKARVGEPAPDFTLTDIQGQLHHLSDYLGQTVVLEWVNPECPFVAKHYSSGNMPGLQRSAAADGVVWLSINSGAPGAQGDFAPDAVAAWMSRTGAAPRAYLRDQTGEVGRLFGAKTTPHLFVINPTGALVYSGAIDDIASTRTSDLAKARNYVVGALAAIKAGEPPTRAETPPYGCSVKY